MKYVPPALAITDPTTVSRVEQISDHVHSAGKVYPTLAAGEAVLTNVAAWTLGVFKQIIPASTIGSPFDIHHILVEVLDDIGVYELVLYYGAGEIECGRVRFVKDAVFSGVLSVPIQTPIIPADSKIQAKCASSVGDSSATISLHYHTY